MCYCGKKRTKSVGFNLIVGRYLSLLYHKYHGKEVKSRLRRNMSDVTRGNSSLDVNQETHDKHRG